MRGFIISSLFVQFVGACFAQPTITAFTPEQGPIGTTVTITGNNFDSNLSANIVFFGATRGTVTAASATSLTVKVPKGATYSAITVLVGGLQAVSANRFDVTFYDPGLDNNSFDDRIEISEDSNPFTLTIGDFDLDGNPDFAASKNNGITLYRNKGVGNLDFSAKANLSESRSEGTCAADFDGDGRLDLVSYGTNNSTYWIYRNTSTGSGSIAFNALVTLNGYSFDAVSAVDADNDGKPDLLAGDSIGVVSIYRNTSSGPGDISFAAPLELSTSLGYCSEDLDGDHIPEVILVDNVRRKLFVYRNISTPGNLAFETRVGFKTGSFPLNVISADLDGDHRFDLILTDHDEHTISIYHNTSSGIGQIQFDTRQIIQADLIPTAISAGDLDGDGLVDLVVSNAENTITVYKNTSSPGSISFDNGVDLEAGTIPYKAAIDDLNGDGRPEIIVSDNNFKKPAISIFRKRGEGEFFSYSLPGQVGISQLNPFTQKITMQVGYATDLSNIAPTFTLSQGCTASVDGSPQTSGVSTVDLTSPITYAVGNDSTMVTKLWTVTVSTSDTDIGDFSFPTQLNAATIDHIHYTIDAEVETPTDLTNMIASFDLAAGAKATVKGINQVSGLTPNNFSSPVIYTISDADSIASQDWTVNVHLSPPTITSFSPAGGLGGTVVTINGTGFDSTIENITVYFGNTPARVTSATPKKLKVVAPAGATYGPIRVLVNTLWASSAEPFLITYQDHQLHFPLRWDNPDYRGALHSRVIAADFDKDGLPDLIYYIWDFEDNAWFITYKNTSIGTVSNDFDAVRQGGAFATNFKPVDLDGDGFLDLPTLTVTLGGWDVYRNSTGQSGQISISHAGGFGSEDVDAQDLSAADFDNDGKIDLAILVPYAKNVLIYRNITLYHGVIQLRSPVALNVGSFAGAIGTADFDNDGKSDLVLTQTPGDSITIYRNTGTGIGDIAFDSHTSIGQLTGSSGLVVGDFNNDHRPDIAAPNQASVVIFGNTSTDTGQISFAPGESYAMDDPGYLSLGDLDGNGEPDIVVCRPSSHALSFLMNQSQGTDSVVFQNQDSLATPWGASSVDVVDLNGDGLAELVVGYQGKKDVVMSIFGESGVTNNTDQPETTTGLDSPAPSILIYPNPASQNLEIEVFEDKGAYSATLTSFLGTTVRSQPLSHGQATINLRGLSQGLYVVRVLQEGKPVAVKAIIIQH